MNKDSLISEFDSIIYPLNGIIQQSDENKLHDLLLAGLQAKKLLDQKQKDILLEKKRLEEELATSQRTLSIRNEQVREANISLRKARMLKKLEFRRNQEVKQNVESHLDALPLNLKRDVLARMTPVRYDSSQSELDITDSNLSSIMNSESNSSDDLYSITDSLTSNRKFSPKRASSLVPVTDTANGVQFVVQQSAATIADANWSIISFGQVSSSTESDRSSVQLFPMILDRLRSRPHELRDRHFVLGDRCSVCHTRIKCGKRGFSCSDCLATVHALCYQELALPCVPLNSPKEERTSSIGGYCCPTFRPQIPALVIHCILQIEERGLNEVGLYRIPVYGRKLQEMKELIEKNKGIPNLTKVNVSIICAVLKDFFASVKQALIPHAIFESMVECFADRPTSKSTFGDLYHILMNLPVPNRDTLIFLILHFQKVAESPACKMSPKSLSKVFTPLLVGNYVISKTYDVERKHCSVLERFMKMPADYFKTVLIKDL